MNRRLLIRPGAVGDCILCMPVLEHLSSDYTEVWVPSTVVPLIRFASAVVPLSATGLDLVGVGDLPIPIALQEKLRSFDSIISWYGESRPEFREPLLRLGVRCQFFRALPPADYSGHATDFFAAQAGVARGLVPRLCVRSRTTRDAIVIHPFSGGKRKNWPLACFRELATRLGRGVEWTAGPEEELTEAFRFEGLDELAEWLSGARLYIGNDSGITHLAAAVGVKTLALFGPTAPETWAPRGENVTVLRRDPLEALQVQDVLAAAKRLLGSS
ncbi:MAG: glycosyltransferase family 9 protein [Acidobacteriaceae bacterium]|nr:glycosyltransferase family 9 protein [Acidobacteriaceae bacterium]